MYNFVIPQELSIKDRIGNYTLPQLGFLAGGLLVVMLLFTMSSIPIWMSILIGMPVLVFCISMAFVRVYHMPCYEFVIVWLMYRSLPKEMIYSAAEYENEEFDFEEEFDDNVLIF